MTNQLTKINPSKALVSAYDVINDRGYFVDSFQDNIKHIGQGVPVHSYRHLNIANNSNVEEAIHFYAAHVVYNYTCNIGDTFRCLIDNDEFTLFIKKDGVYFIYLSDEDAINMSSNYYTYDSLTSFEKEVEF